tara:strand:+ start:9781 stop:10566 length:786 start_codon:yes stop_codon:yes gene_type:complete
MMNSNKLSVVKIGGSTIDDWHKSIGQVNEIISMGNSLVIVHGGGKTVSDWGSKLGIRPEFVKGLRKTDSKTLEVAIAILSGLVNSKLVSFLNKNKINSVGISGLSGNMIEAEISDQDLGLVGEIKNLNTDLVQNLLNNDYVPVISPVGINQNSKNTGDSILNINADYVASEIAKNLKANKLIYQTDVDGIRDGNGRIISKMTLTQAKDLINSGIVVGGMLPKLESCINSMQGVDRSHIINGSDNSLIEVFKGNRIGTEIIN